MKIRSTEGDRLLNNGVYVFQESGSLYIKIGQSNDIHSRLKELQIGNPRKLVPLAVLPGGNEKECHEKYTDCRVRGEWFLMTPAMAWVIREEWVLLNQTEELLTLVTAYLLSWDWDKQSSEEPMSSLNTQGIVK